MNIQVEIVEQPSLLRRHWNWLWFHFKRYVSHEATFLQTVWSGCLLHLWILAFSFAAATVATIVYVFYNFLVNLW